MMLSVREYKERLLDFIRLKWHQIVAILLTIQGLFNLGKSLKFLFIDYPALETQLAAHLITADEVTRVTNKIILMVISATISLFFALHIRALKTKTAKIISTSIGIIIMIANANLSRILHQLGTDQLLTEAVITGIKSLLHLEEEVRSSLPELPPELQTP